MQGLEVADMDGIWSAGADFIATDNLFVFVVSKLRFPGTL